LDKPFLEHSWEDSRKVMDVNVMGTFFSAQAAAQHMRDQNVAGSIVMIASVAAHCAIPSQRVSIYGASKAAVKLLGMTLAVELAPFQIRVNTISPGFIATNMTGDMAKSNPELLSVFTNTPPLGRMGERSDLTLAVAYLLSEGARYTTGADLPITGALHAGRIRV
jgi:sorbose reductase